MFGGGVNLLSLPWLENEANSVVSSIHIKDGFTKTRKSARFFKGYSIINTSS